MIKKIILLMLAAFILSGALSSCDELVSDDDDSDRTEIVCTIFPEYDWTRQILGDNENAEITYLLDKGTDLHNYQPSANDMIKISNCDLFIYVGGESDVWVDDALKNAQNKDMHVINLMEVMGDSAKTEEVKEGMMAESEEEGEEEEEEYDEHFWTSLKNAELFCSEICSALCSIDPENAEKYKSNADQYSQKLENMDNEFKELFDSMNVKALIFGDRFPFRYFTDDYGLDYYAAFVGCSAETEASFETISFLAGKTDELEQNSIFVLENSDHSIAEGIIQNTKTKDQKIVELNSMQSVTGEMVNSGTTYLGLMEKNYEALKEAFS